jgi:hypothetical protein
MATVKRKTYKDTALGKIISEIQPNITIQLPGLCHPARSLRLKTAGIYLIDLCVHDSQYCEVGNC